MIQKVQDQKGTKAFQDEAFEMIYRTSNSKKVDKKKLRSDLEPKKMPINIPEKREMLENIKN